VAITVPIVAYFVERRPVKLTPEEENARHLAFENLLSRKALQIMNLGTWTNQEEGERLIERGKPVESSSPRTCLSFDTRTFP
jgi:hypothetical protein